MKDWRGWALIALALAGLLLVSGQRDAGAPSLRPRQMLRDLFCDEALDYRQKVRGILADESRRSDWDNARQELANAQRDVDRFCPGEP